MSRRALGIGATLAVVLVALIVGLVVGRSDGGSGDDDDATETTAAPEPVASDVMVVGDSFPEQSRDAILDQGRQRSLDVGVDAFGGSSVCDWMPRIKEVAEDPPRIVVLAFAGNITTPCINPTCDPGPCEDQDPAVNAERYRTELTKALGLFDPAVTKLFLVIPPPTAKANLEPYTAAIRGMYRSFSQEHPEVQVIDSGTRLDPDGVGFVAALPCYPQEDCTPEGVTIVRQDDLAHLTPAGGLRYALAIYDVIDLSL
ncbi:MAG TPA: hypothetical protein VGJ86_24515 [Acidimicrobiales bacterium]|jgi:hypothetical protein